jgi:hypothetical protein
MSGTSAVGALVIMVVALVVVFSMAAGMRRLIKMAGPKGRIIYLYIAVATLACGVFQVIRGDRGGYKTIAVSGMAVAGVAKWLNKRPPGSD